MSDQDHHQETIDMEESVVKKDTNLTDTYSPEITVFLFEFISMAFFAYGIICAIGASKKQMEVSGLNEDTSAEKIAVFFFGAVCLSAPFSGAHINPAVTLGMLLSNRIGVGIAIIYWVAQFAGAFTGAFLCYIVLGDITSPMIQNEEYYWIVADFVGEAFGTTTFIFFILVQTTPETTFTPKGNPLTTYSLVALALYLSRGFTQHSGGVINPGMALSFEMFVSYQNQNIENLKFLWLFSGGPAVGAVAAAFLFQIYKRLVPLNPAKETS